MNNPYISIIMPVLNEADSINPTLERLGALNIKEGFEVIVADGSSEGTTLQAIRPGIHRKIRLKTTLAPKGRGAQMNQGAVLAEGDILIFLHADTRIPQEALNRLLLGMKGRKAIAAGAFNLGIHSSKKVYRVIELMANLRTRITRLPYGDQAQFLRKAYFFKINGFSEIPLMEDVDIMQRIKKRNDGITIIQEKIQTSPRRWEKEGIVYCTLRNWLLVCLYLLGVSPNRLARFYKF